MRTMLVSLLLLTACATPDPAPPYQPADALVFTPDLVSAFDTWDATRGGSGTWDGSTDFALSSPGLVVFVSHLNLAPIDGEDSWRTPDAALEAEMIDELLGGLALFRIDDGSRVEATAQRGCVDVQGADHCGSISGYPLSLVPNAPLREGWYLFRADFSSLRRRGVDFAFQQARHEGDIAYARFYWGSHAAHSAMYVTPDSRAGSAYFSALITEPISPVLQASSRLEVEIDGVLQTCEHASGDFGVGASCPLPSSGSTIRMTLRGDQIPDVEGTLERTVELSAASLYEGNSFVRVDVVPSFGLERLAP